MKILGIDPGFGLCGFAVLQVERGQDPHLLTCGVIKTSPKKPFAERLEEIAQDFEELLQSHSPDLVAIEDLFFAQNVTTALQVAQVRGVLVHLATAKKLPLAEPKPVEVKQAFTGNGKATKAEMKKMAELLFGAGKSVDDAVDAIAVAYTVG